MGAQVLAFPTAAVQSSFEAAWSAIPSTMKTRSLSRAKLKPIWDAAAKRVGGQDVLLAALRAYLKGDKDLPKSGGPALDRWLRNEKFDHWLPGESCSVLAEKVTDGVERVKFPVEAIRTAAIAALGLPWTISYLDRCEVAEGPHGPVLVVSSPTAASRLREKGQELKAIGLYGIRLKPVGS